MTSPIVRRVTLPGRGTLSLLECAGPPGAQTLILLHGVTMNAALGWAKVMEPLGRHFRVIAPDLRGHGDGLPLRGRFSLEESADDIAALASAMDIELFVAVGYSMGGTVAQLLWRRHPHRVSALVLCATGRNFRGSQVEKLLALAMPAITGWPVLTMGFTSDMLRSSVLGPIGDDKTRGWARAQLARTSLTTALSAMQAVSEFTSHDWIDSVTVPTAVLVTTHDSLVPPKRQRRLAESIEGSVVFELAAEHGACVTAPEAFGRLLLLACQTVTTTPDTDRPPPHIVVGAPHPESPRVAP